MTADYTPTPEEVHRILCDEVLKATSYIEQCVSALYDAADGLDRLDDVLRAGLSRSIATSIDQSLRLYRRSSSRLDVFRLDPPQERRDSA